HRPVDLFSNHRLQFAGCSLGTKTFSGLTGDAQTTLCLRFNQPDFERLQKKSSVFQSLQQLSRTTKDSKSGALSFRRLGRERDEKGGGEMDDVQRGRDSSIVAEVCSRLPQHLLGLPVSHRQSERDKNPRTPGRALRRTHRQSAGGCRVID
ncbi:unnamed protein product, partial [Pleuronectes platessa]